MTIFNPARVQKTSLSGDRLHIQGLRADSARARILSRSTRPGHFRARSSRRLKYQLDKITSREVQKTMNAITINMRAVHEPSYPYAHQTPQKRTPKAALHLKPMKADSPRVGILCSHVQNVRRDVSDTDRKTLTPPGFTQFGTWKPTYTLSSRPKMDATTPYRATPIRPKTMAWTTRPAPGEATPGDVMMYPTVLSEAAEQFVKTAYAGDG